jgi:hypothetical protein
LGIVNEVIVVIVQTLNTFKVKVADAVFVYPVTVPVIFKLYEVPSYDEDNV